MQLEFKKQNGLYEVEFEVTGDFNLHLERKNYGRVELYQKTSSETNYTSSPSYSANGDAIINLDFSMGVYPKFVKIISYTEVEKAIVTIEDESGDAGSGSSGSLRPVTDYDVTLELEDGVSGQTTPIPFATSIFLEQKQNLIVRYEKEIFIGTNSIFSNNSDSLNSNSMKYYNFTTPQEVKLDLYTKD